MYQAFIEITDKFISYTSPIPICLVIVFCCDIQVRIWLNYCVNKYISGDKNECKIIIAFE